MRCGQLGLIDPARKTSLFKQLSARGWRKNEPVRVHPESPALLAKLIEHRFGEGLTRSDCLFSLWRPSPH